MPLSVSNPSTGPASDALADHRNNVSITDAATCDLGRLDGVGTSLRAAELAAAGFGPGDAVRIGGVDFTMPAVDPGRPDNFTPSVHETMIALSGRGNAIALLGTAASFTGLDLTVHYTDHSSQRVWVGLPGCASVEADPLALSTIATTVRGRNGPSGADVDLDSSYAIFGVGVNIDPGKTVETLAVACTGIAHLYDLQITTLAEPYPVDAVLGRPPQPTESPCDELIAEEDRHGEYSYWERADPSTHLRYHRDCGDLPTGATAFYNEITVQSSAPASYFMTNGYAGGYYGIQEGEDGSKVAIFSIFGPDSGTVDDDKLTSTVLYRIGHGDFVIHGEYAGGPSIRIPFDWTVGETYSTMITNQPDTGGDDHAQIVSAWLNTQPIGRSPEWIKLMTVRTERPTDSSLHLHGLHSFVEDFLRDGSFTAGRMRSAAYSNAAIYRSDLGWQPLDRVAFSGQLSGRLTIQNDAYPTAGRRCAITNLTCGSDIAPSDVHSGQGTIWTTHGGTPPCGPPEESLAPLENGAPIQQATTTLEVGVSVSTGQLAVETRLLADDEPVRVTLDGRVVSPDDLAAAADGTMSVTVALAEPLTIGPHTVEVTGRSSNLRGAATVPALGCPSADD